MQHSFLPAPRSPHGCWWMLNVSCKGLVSVALMKHNVRFFLDILQNRKSDTLEWIIILLIAGEICLGLYEIISTAMKQRASVEGPKLASEFS